MRKESEKEYIYVQLNHYAVHQNLTQHCKLTILQFKKKVGDIHLEYGQKDILQNQSFTKASILPEL